MLEGATGKLEVRFIDVGQGDATLIACPDGNHHLLIDSGDNRYPGSSKKFRSFLTNSFKGKPFRIDVAIASHVHATGGMNE